MKFAAVEYQCGPFCLKIFPAGKKHSINWNNAIKTDSSCVFYSLKDDASNEKSYVEYVRDDELNIEPIHLKETIRYQCSIESNDESVADFNLHFNNEDNKFLKIERDDDDRLVFQFINYLGKTTIFFEKKEKYHLSFEVVPDKIAYKDDYVNLTKAIAEECAALLLDYTSPTSHVFSQDFEKKSKTPLEQFIFLRQFCYAENLESLFAFVKRNPDRQLVSENELKPLGTGVISQKFFTSPFSFAREWNDLGDGRFLPSEISTTRKYDSFNTPANRFLKFALSAFLEVCENIAKNVDSKSMYAKEAGTVREYIEDILQDSFFNDVMDLTIMPSNNQVLEKREGYSQIFKAYSMMDLALKLDWKGKEDVYSGEAKNTALLYEYWLFFELRKIIKEIDGCRLIRADDGTESFVKDEDGLSIVLQQGRKSVERFEQGNLRINLYYNYTFERKDFKNTKYEGSYSRPFRPDYTIAIFPKIFKNEQEAVKNGEVHYIHFDAKYRLENLNHFFNKDSSPDNTKKEIEDEKNDSVTNTYKRGDLLKMHTYNDAIRSTVGSFVLYPGMSIADNRYSVYEEILPGVGAFAIRPGNAEVGETALKMFIQDIISFCDNPSSRIARTEYFEKMISESPSENSPAKASIENSNLFMIGFLRDEYHEWLIDNHFIPQCDVKSHFYSSDKKIYFYYHAIRDGYVYPLHKDISKAKYFCARHKGDYAGETEVKKFNVDPWFAEIESTELVSVKDLAERLKEMNDGNGFIPHRQYSAEYYYLVTLKNIKLADFSRDSFDGVDSGNLAISAYSPKIAKRVK